MRFTQSNVLKLKAPAGKSDAWIPDDTTPGLGVRFRNGGPGVYAVRFSIGGKDGRQSFAAVASVSLNDARAWARRQNAGIAEGVSPALTRARAVQKASDTFEPLIGGYLTHLAANGRTPGYVAENARSFQRYLKALHGHSVGDITKRMVAAELARIRAERGPISGNHARAHLSAFYGWAIANGLCETNPVNGTFKSKAGKRERALSDVELASIWQALGADDYGAICRLLILSGARRDEIGSLRRSEINVELRQIELPGSRTKNKLDHTIPLSPLASSILTECTARTPNREHVFGRGNGGFSGWSKCKERLDARLSLKPWCLHDLRHTLSTTMNERGIAAPHIVEAILGHVSGHRSGVAGVYNHASYPEQKRAALDAWAAYIAELIARRS